MQMRGACSSRSGPAVRRPYIFNRIVSAIWRSRAEEEVLANRFPWPGEVGNAQEYFLRTVVVDNDDEFARPGYVRDAGDSPVVSSLDRRGEKRRSNTEEQKQINLRVTLTSVTG
ncbi:hypothetical protein EDB87DRAFT_1575298 [Lactarius vividus]|nr:hypothetical protein EDB87DRAFT_1575298 [Lactarius vividus]